MLWSGRKAGRMPRLRHTGEQILVKRSEAAADFLELRHFSDFCIPNSCRAMVPKAGPMIGIYSRLHAIVKMRPPVVRCRD
jgi:hypothetical protein